MEYNDKLKHTIRVLEPSELESSVEKKLYDSILEQSDIKSRTAYENRLFTGENILVGVAALLGINDAIMVVRREYETPFDTYDQETFESILGYATILFDTLTLIHLVEKSDRWE